MCTGLAPDCRWSVMDRRGLHGTHPLLRQNYQLYADAGAGEVAIRSCIHISEFISFQWVVSYSGSHGWPCLNSLAHKTKAEARSETQPEDGEGIHIEDVSLTQIWGEMRERRG